MNNSPGVFDEGEGQVVIGTNRETKKPIIMYNPIAVCEKFESRARDARSGKRAIQSGEQVEKLSGVVASLQERLAFAEEQLAKSSERAAAKVGFDKK